MNTKFLEKITDYNGSQLRSGWVTQQTGLMPDALVTFTGGCDIRPEFMVDLEDLKAGHKIFSQKMLHFIGEFADHDLEKAILRQRLLITQIQQHLLQDCPSLNLFRTGNDLYEKENFKITISVATTSPTSSLFHTGINIDSRKTPVPTKGLDDFKIDPKVFAEKILTSYRDEIASIHRDFSKVKKVP